MATSLRSEIGSYLIITTAALLIWFWAAGETREQKTINCTIEFVAPDSKAWIIEPSLHTFNMSVEGSRLAIQRLETLAQEGLTYTVVAEVGEQIVDIAQALHDDPEFKATGAALLSIDRPQATPLIDQLITMELSVTPSLPGVQTVEAQPRVEPSSVTLTLPSRLQSQFPNIQIQAFLDQNVSSQLSEDVPHQLDIPPRLLPVALSNIEHVSIEPALVKLSFTIRSQIRELTLDTPVNVQLQGPWEDQNDFLVELETDRLRDVTVIADAELIRQIESGEATVIAIVHLKSRDKQNIVNGTGQAEKPVSFFMAIVEDVGYPVQVTINGSDVPPMISLRVTARPSQPAGE
ncbi:MAG: hypothetical protein O7G85_09010 [Planctomycetota bacterium]|nr:hypothetical protein [Planctomycetota bacterium]